MSKITRREMLCLTGSFIVGNALAGCQREPENEDKNGNTVFRYLDISRFQMYIREDVD